MTGEERKERYAFCWKFQEHFAGDLFTRRLSEIQIELHCILPLYLLNLVIALGLFQSEHICAGQDAIGGVFGGVK